MLVTADSRPKAKRNAKKIQKPREGLCQYLTQGETRSVTSTTRSLCVRLLRRDAPKVAAPAAYPSLAHSVTYASSSAWDRTM